MSIARHHNEWLSLVEASGPFLSLPVLLRVFPQGLDVAHEPELTRTLRLVYEEWLGSQEGPRPEVAIHTQWLRWVLANVLEIPKAALLEGPELPADFTVEFPEYGERLRPDFGLQAPDEARPRLLIQQYPANQKLDKFVTGRRWAASPAERMLQLLRRLNIRLGLVTNGEHWMLVHALPASKDEPASYISWYSAAWLEEPITLRAFRSLLRAYRFLSVDEKNSLEALFIESAGNQQEVTDQLGYQVRRAVETLVEMLDRMDRERLGALLRGIAESELYQAALTVMMRLVFLMSAEEQGMLPLGEIELYDDFYAVSTLGAQLRATADRDGEEILERYHDAWSRLLATFRLVYGGVQHAEMNLPAYGGDLFDPDKYPFLEGRLRNTTWESDAADPLRVDNRTVLHLLDSLQMLEVSVPGGGSEKRRLSFRALDIEQIGHVYEGLLDHGAVRATGTVLGLRGGRDHEEEISLDELEKQQARGEKLFLEYLKERTQRSTNALQKDLAVKLEGIPLNRMRTACDNDDHLLGRIKPFAGLIRNDSFGRPVVILPGSVYVTQSSDRRSTGTHYTPRSLTEPLVKHTLDPLVYIGPAEGLPEGEWRLRSAEELLQLKICDMAMGSGAFLVQACRYLSEKLVQAWDEESIATDTHGLTQIETTVNENPNNSNNIRVHLSPSVADDLPLDRGERLALARRVVAERCLYGVDKNPMAVEMAKLSLWLTTLDRHQPFTFLNHALRGGDSLLGITRLNQLKNWAMGEVDFGELEHQTVFVQEMVRKAVGRTLEARFRIKQMAVNGGARLNFEKARLQKQAEEEMELVRLGADLLVAETLADMHPDRIGLDPLFLEYTVLGNTFETAHEENFTEQGRAEGRAAFASLRQRVDTLLKGRNPFHWALEFPEVFVGGDRSQKSEVRSQNGFTDNRQSITNNRSGFDALIGNPPFQGGQKITGALGTDYRDYLVENLAGGKRGSADLCAYFFLRANDLTMAGGQAGLLATNTIGQGDTREVGLEQLVEKGWTIPRAVPSRKWPGGANLEVSHIWLKQGIWKNNYVLDDVTVASITPFLTKPGETEGKPYSLTTNSNKSFIGSYVLGMGFILESYEAQALIAKDPRNKEVLFPYLNGEDLNSTPDQSPSRWVINFFDRPLDRSALGSWLEAGEKERTKYLQMGRVPSDYPGTVADDYPDCIAILRNKIQPERQRVNEKNEYVLRYPLYLKWWIHGEKRPALYSTIADMERVLVRARVSNTSSFVFAPRGLVYSEQLVVFATDTNASLSILNSNIHNEWVLNYCSTLGVGIRYTPSDCFENFPFPEESRMARLEGIGERYYQHRQSIMQSRQEGLTKTYNRFHNPEESSPDITQLRDLHREMDEAVAVAYGWSDLALEHGFHQTKQGLRYTISEAARREVLGRLLTLNHQRYAAEVAAGLHDKKKGSGGGGRGSGKKGAGKSSQESGVRSQNGTSDNRQPTTDNRQPPLFEVEPAGSLWEWAEKQGESEE